MVVSDSLPQHWERHENLVGELYESMGYKVTPNINIDGKQVDLVCEKFVAGAGLLKLYIDCKHVGKRGRSVSNRDIDEFINAFESRKQNNNWTHGVIASNLPFSQYARSATAKHTDIILKTIDDIYDDLLLIRPYLHLSMRSYEENGTFDSYIPLRSRITDGRGQPTGHPFILRQQVHKWLQASDSPQLVLLGDFGSGKTTFLQYLHYELAKQYLAKGDCRIPILVTLRDYYDAPSAAELIERFFSLEMATKVPFKVFARFLQTGRFLLLLDGFDEMGANSDLHVRKRNWIKLSQLVLPKSKTIISCRPAYFVDHSELVALFTDLERQVGYTPHKTRGDKTATSAYADLSKFLDSHAESTRLEDLFEATGRSFKSTFFVYLELFNNSQVRAYLNKQEPLIREKSGGKLNTQLMISRIREIYDLKDLVKRPILLKLIVNTLPLFHQDADGFFKIEIKEQVLRVPEITPAILYYVYTEEELRRDYEKGEVRQLIDRPTKRNIITNLAFRMFDSPNLAIDHEDVAAVVSDVLKPENKETLEHYVTDIRTCAFLARDISGGFRFTHKSFLEYFIAQYLLNTFTSKNAVIQNLSTRFLPEEIAYFLGDSIAAFEPVHIRLLHEVNTGLPKASHESMICIQNIINLLNHARQPLTILKDLQANLVAYPKNAMKYLKIENCQLGELRFRSTHTSALDIIGCSLKCLSLNNDKIMNLKIDSTTIEKLEIFGAALSLDVKNSVIRQINCSSVTFGQINVNNSSFMPTEWSNTTIKKGMFQHALIMSPNHRHLQGCTLITSVFSHCIFMDIDCDGDFLSQAVFSSCLFIRCKKSDAKGLERLQGSSGFFLCPDKSEEFFERETHPCLWSKKRALAPVNKLQRFSYTQLHQKYLEFHNLSKVEQLAVVFPADSRQTTPSSYAEVIRKIDQFPTTILSMTPTIENNLNRDVKIYFTPSRSDSALAEQTNYGLVPACTTRKLRSITFTDPYCLYRVEAVNDDNETVFSKNFSERDLEKLSWRITLGTKKGL